MSNVRLIATGAPNTRPSQKGKKYYFKRSSIEKPASISSKQATSCSARKVKVTLAGTRKDTE